MSKVFYEAACWGFRPLSKAEKKKKMDAILGTPVYELADEALQYFSLKPEHFTVLEDNERVRVDVSVEIRVEWYQGLSDWRNQRSKTWKIPAGYEFDGASIPPMFWDLIGEPDDEKFLIAALIHDFLYEKRWNRKLSDATFRHFLESEGVWGFKATLMWAAVRIGGFAFYAGDTSKFWAKVRNFL